MNEKNVNREFERLRVWLWSVKGHKCVYCKGEATELHHIIPRKMGGDNRLSNIVPLCYQCHLKAHGKYTAKREKKKKPALPKPDNFNDVASLYLDGKLPLKSALRLTELGNSRFYKYLHEYAETHNKSDLLKERRRKKCTLVRKTNNRTKSDFQCVKMLVS